MRAMRMLTLTTRRLPPVTMLIVAIAVGCKQPEVIEFPSRLQHLEEIRAPLPEGDGFPEELAIVDGGDSDLWWSHGRGYVHAPIGDVWAAFQQPEVGINYREVDEWDVTYDTRPEFDHSYTTHIVVRDIVRIEYDLTWVSEQQAADEDGNITQVALQWEKTDGSIFIQRLAGSVLLLPADEGTKTEVQLVHHLIAAQRDQDVLTQTLLDIHANVVAAVNGESIPAFTP